MSLTLCVKSYFPLNILTQELVTVTLTCIVVNDCDQDGLGPSLQSAEVNGTDLTLIKLKVEDESFVFLKIIILFYLNGYAIIRSG